MGLGLGLGQREALGKGCAVCASHVRASMSRACVAFACVAFACLAAPCTRNAHTKRAGGLCMLREQRIDEGDRLGALGETGEEGGSEALGDEQP